MASPSSSPYNNGIPLPSPMHWDPHATQLSFGALAAHTGFPPRSLCLGLDLSTQALKGCFVDEALTVVAEYEVRFDQDLPHCNTKSGVHIEEGGVVTSPTIMFVEAIELLFTRIAASPAGKEILSQTVAISGAAQQHGTVYWSKSAAQTLGSLNAQFALKDQLVDAFSRPVSPNWQDSSTTAECREMEAAIGGAEEMARRTGSRAHERFSGSQIMKFRKQQPDVYAETDRISLVSSFLTTMLCADGEIKSVEESDACGMNLWDMADSTGWDKELLQVVAGDSSATELEKKLGPVELDGGASAGKVGRYYVDRYGINPDAVVCYVTGDNNGTILSFSLETNQVVISLGTSDTILLSTTAYVPHPDWHVFSYPANREGGKRSFMAMLCYKNGSLPREHVRDQYANGSWDVFNEHVESIGAPTVEQAASRDIGFYFLKPEIIPHRAYGVHRFSKGKSLKEFDVPKYNARAILESQFLSFKMRVGAMLSSSDKPDRVFAVGGGSRNTTILQTLSTVLGAPVSTPGASSANSCALGGAMKAHWCWRRAQSGEQSRMTFEEAVAEARSKQQSDSGFGDTFSATKSESESTSSRTISEPEAEATKAYGLMMDRFKSLEDAVVASVVSAQH